MEDSFITLISKMECSKNCKRFFRPTKIGIAKSLIRCVSTLKDRDSLFSLLKLFCCTQRTIIVVNITMNANLNTTLRYIRQQCRVPTQNNCGNEEGGCCFVLAKSFYSSKQRLSCPCFSNAKPSENCPETPREVVNTLCFDRKGDKIHSTPLKYP